MYELFTPLSRNSRIYGWFLYGEDAWKIMLVIWVALQMHLIKHISGQVIETIWKVLYKGSGLLQYCW